MLRVFLYSGPPKIQSFRYKCVRRPKSFKSEPKNAKSPFFLPSNIKIYRTSTYSKSRAGYFYKTILKQDQEVTIWMMRKCRVWKKYGQFKRSCTVLRICSFFIAFLPAGLLLWAAFPWDVVKNILWWYPPAAGGWKCDDKIIECPCTTRGCHGQ